MKEEKSPYPNSNCYECQSKGKRHLGRPLMPWKTKLFISVVRF
jgi:hypothetical protein